MVLASLMIGDSCGFSAAVVKSDVWQPEPRWHIVVKSTVIHVVDCDETRWRQERLQRSQSAPALATFLAASPEDRRTILEKPEKMGRTKQQRRKDTIAQEPGHASLAQRRRRQRIANRKRKQAETAASAVEPPPRAGVVRL